MLDVGLGIWFWGGLTGVPSASGRGTGQGTARGRVYWMAFDPSVHPLAITDTGYYEDVCEKTRDGWRIKERTAYSDPQPAN